jgi:cell wall-associated NlpC family hydrolase
MARTPRERVAYMKAHPPGKVGMCARTVWLSLGVPPLHAANASVAVRKVKAAGKLHTSDENIPYGAVVLWTGGRHGYGHAALYVGDDKILTTDPPGHPGKVGITRLNMPRVRWGLHYAGWTTWWGQELPK